MVNGSIQLDTIPGRGLDFVLKNGLVDWSGFLVFCSKLPDLSY